MEDEHEREFCFTKHSGRTGRWLAQFEGDEVAHKARQHLSTLSGDTKLQLVMTVPVKGVVGPENLTSHRNFYFRGFRTPSPPLLPYMVSLNHVHMFFTEYYMGAVATNDDAGPSQVRSVNV
jgi:hypothetical protein